MSDIEKHVKLLMQFHYQNDYLPIGVRKDSEMARDQAARREAVEAAVEAMRKLEEIREWSRVERGKVQETIEDYGHESLVFPFAVGSRDRIDLLIRKLS